MSTIIYHNPRCGTSRNVLAFIRATGQEPQIVEYLSEGWTVPQLQALFEAAGVTPRQALRVKTSPADELGLLDPSVSDQALLSAMVAHPILVERPFVRTVKGVRLCRPAERVFDLLETPPLGPLRKETGELVIDETGKFVAGAS